MIDDNIITDFLVRLYFGKKQTFHQAGLKRAYLDFNRTLKNDKTQAERDFLQSQTQSFLEKKLKKLIKTEFKNQTEFDIAHENLCKSLIEEWDELKIGQCQKWINMTLKYWLVFGNDKISSISKNYQFFHIPIDSIIQKGIFKFWKKQKPWSKIDKYEDYFVYQTEFRKLHKNEIPIKYEFEFFNNA